MSTTPPMLPYASPVISTCPLCQTRPVVNKKIYRHPVCKKCFYKFTNRRQLGYLADSILFIVPNILVVALASTSLAHTSVTPMESMAILFCIGFGLGCVFCLRDGIGGVSPGKWMTNLIVLSDVTQQPISFQQSFKRNAILLVAHIPLLGSVAALGVIVTMAIQVGKGYRLGDRLGKTRVIWKKYAHTAVFTQDTTLCRGCGYSLEGNVSGVCPECGRPNETAIAVAQIPAD